MINRKRNWYGYLLAFLFPVALYVLFCVWSGVYPFGDLSNLRDDLKIQYIDYFSYYRNVLLGSGDIGYSFTKSLGGSLVALWGYYLASPFNLLVVLFRQDQLQLFVSVITTLKIGLSGLTFYLFSRYKFKNAKWYLLLLLSTAYAFTQYNVGQMANLNWLDGVYMLPLMLLGVCRYVHEDKKGLLFASTALSIVFNWYTGYMNCIFIFLFYLYEQALCDSKHSRLAVMPMVKKAVRFGVLEVLSVLFSMAAFLPVLLGQSGGRSFMDDNIFSFATNGSLLDILRGFLIGSENPSTNKNITLFCSVLMLVCAVYFFCRKHFNKTEKRLTAALVGIMVASLFFAPIEHVWCGFKFENSFAFRFLYVAILALLIPAGRTLEELDTADRRSLGYTCLGIIGVLLVLDMQKSFNAFRLWVQIALLCLYPFLLVAGKKSRHGRVIALVCVLALFTAELSYNANLVSGDKYTADADAVSAYMQNERELTAQLAAVDDGFFRTEKTLNRDKSKIHESFYANESMAYSTYGIQHYSSSYDLVTAEMLRDLGYANNVFPSFYHGPLLAADSLLGVKYLLSEQPYDGFVKVEGMESYNDKSVYKNQYALPLAFSAADMQAVQASDDPYAYISGIYSGILGKQVDLFREVTDTATVTVSGKNTVFTIPAVDENTVLYLHIDGSDMMSDIVWEGQRIAWYRKSWMNYHVIVLGNLAQERVLKVSDLPSNCKVRLYALDMETFGGVIDAVRQQNAVDTIDVRDGHIALTVSGNTADSVMLTVPFDESWRATVNGQAAAITSCAGGFMSIDVSDLSDAEIVLQYHVRGILPGAVLTVVALVAFIGWCLWERKKQKTAA